MDNCKILFNIRRGFIVNKKAKGIVFLLIILVLIGHV